MGDGSGATPVRLAGGGRSPVQLLVRRRFDLVKEPATIGKSFERKKIHWAV
jgi:hypothetical protein